MNNGNLEKVFITCGKDVSSAMALFASEWEKGCITHLEATSIESALEEVTLHTSEDKAYFILVDVNTESLSQAQSVTSKTWARNQAEVICFTCDESSTDSNDIHNQLEIPPQHRVQLFPIDCFGAVISAYGHVMTGFSISCVGFDDVYSILDTGTTVTMQKIICDNAKESPYSLYTGYEKLVSEGKQKSLTLTGVVAVVIGDIADPNIMEVTEACGFVLRGLAHDLDYIIHTNLQSDARCEVLLCGVLKEVAIANPFNDGNELPNFLKNIRG
ncbi:hypothetical protein ORI98_15645 [Shewanella sp. ULN5]|uniref:hypothetical protein n=1 Tax=Shewanella sp. ULN5 TaxID=2994678 RepID=UPI00273D2D12|nr:hypothetical protein [Shewanella sp. ULN5]MDP5147875.1 hypothetical protein [Shewanella sp. ULN5]